MVCFCALVSLACSLALPSRAAGSTEDISWAPEPAPGPAPWDPELSPAPAPWSPSTDGLIFVEDFEEVDTSIWQEDFDGETGQIVASVADGGRSGGCLDFTVSYCDDGSCYRSEYKRPKGVELELGKEYWFGFTLRLLADVSYQDTDDPNIYHFQLHGGDNVGRAPVLGLQIHNHDWPLRYRLLINGDDDPSSSASHNPKWALTKEAGDIVPGEWDDFVFHVRLEYSQTGFVQAWRNGEMFADEWDIATAFNDNNPPYLKLGAYVNKPFKTSGGVETPWWGVSYWQLKVGDESSSYDEVSTAQAANDNLQVV